VQLASPSRRALGLAAAGALGLSTLVVGLPGIAAASTALPGSTTITVPDGACGLALTLTGGHGAAAGGNPGGAGDVVGVTLPVVAHDDVSLEVVPLPGGTATGGGAGGTAIGVRWGGDLVAIAGGGGGAGTGTGAYGGAAGGDADPFGGDFDAGSADDQWYYGGGLPGQQDGTDGAGGYVVDDDADVPVTSAEGAPGVDGAGGSGGPGAGAGGSGWGGGGAGASDGTDGAGGGSGSSYVNTVDFDVADIAERTANTGAAAGASYDWVTCPPAQAPGAPDIDRVDAGDGSATVVAWPGEQDPADDSALTYEYRLDGGSPHALTTSPGGGDLVEGPITGLTNGTAYSVQVRNTSDAGTSAWSDAVSVTPVHLVGAPTAFGATVGVSSIRLSWAPPAGETVIGYEAWAIPGADPQSNAGQVDCAPLGADARSCVLGVPAGQQYTVGVRSAGGSSTFLVTAVVPAPSVPATVPTASAPLGTADTSLTPGQEVTVSGTGFLPNSTVSLAVYSTPTTLGTVTADAQGAFRREVTIPSSLAAGAHTLVAAGVDAQGNPRYLTQAITVTTGSGTAAAGTGGTGALAYTGASVALPALGGLAALAVGGGLVVAGRRKRA
jgi:hypothetical protein